MTDHLALTAFLHFINPVDVPDGPTPAHQATGCDLSRYAHHGETAGSDVCASIQSTRTNHTKRPVASVFWSFKPLNIGASRPERQRHHRPDEVVARRSERPGRLGLGLPGAPGVR